MQNITIGRYDHPEKTGGWAGWIEPEDRSWILFIALDGTTKFYSHRDGTGGVIE